MTSSIIYSRLDIKIERGSQAISSNISLENGTCLGVHFIPMKTNNPEFPIEIEVKAAQGGTVLDPVDYRDYIHREGGYFNGMKQVNFPTKGNRFYITVLAEKPLTEDFVGQLIFTIQRECEGKI